MVELANPLSDIIFRQLFFIFETLEIFIIFQKFSKYSKKLENFSFFLNCLNLILVISVLTNRIRDSTRGISLKNDIARGESNKNDIVLSQMRYYYNIDCHHSVLLWCQNVLLFDINIILVLAWYLTS